MAILVCGGRGPCCHIGYAHRHCEHCDTVIATAVQPHVHGSYGYPWYGTYGIYNGLLYPLASQQQLNGVTNQFQQLASSQYNVTEVPIDGHPVE